MQIRRPDNYFKVVISHELKDTFRREPAPSKNCCLKLVCTVFALILANRKSSLLLF